MDYSPLKIKILKDAKKSKTSQVTLEMAVGFVLIFVFILGIIRMWGWSNAQIAGRQPAYNKTRVAAGGRDPGFWPVYKPGELTEKWVFAGYPKAGRPSEVLSSRISDLPRRSWDFNLSQWDYIFNLEGDTEKIRQAIADLEDAILKLTEGLSKVEAEQKRWDAIHTRAESDYSAALAAEKAREPTGYFQWEEGTETCHRSGVGTDRDNPPSGYSEENCDCGGFTWEDSRSEWSCWHLKTSWETKTTTNPLWHENYDGPFKTEEEWIRDWANSTYGELVVKEDVDYTGYNEKFNLWDNSEYYGHNLSQYVFYETSGYDWRRAPVEQGDRKIKNEQYFPTSQEALGRETLAQSRVNEYNVYIEKIKQAIIDLEARKDKLLGMLS